MGWVYREQATSSKAGTYRMTLIGYRFSYTLLLNVEGTDTQLTICFMAKPQRLLLEGAVLAAQYCSVNGIACSLAKQLATSCCASTSRSVPKAHSQLSCHPGFVGNGVCRAFLKAPPMLLFDEATSSLDRQAHVMQCCKLDYSACSVHKLAKGVKHSLGRRKRKNHKGSENTPRHHNFTSKTLAHLCKSLDTSVQNFQERLLSSLSYLGRTSIFVAHRLSTAAQCDQIVVLDKGRVVETGSHVELLQRGGRYAELWWKQASGTH
eukprot:1158892-Pelagomonas_calceolata.AAC.13